MMLSGIVIFIVIASSAIAALVAFGTGTPPPPLASISNPFEKVDFGDLPAAETVPARKGRSITFRRWPTAETNEPETILIAIHGSSASSHSIHPLAKPIAAAGISVYAPDIRGHGQTGRRGDIDYPSELDDDLEDFVAAVKKIAPSSQLVLLGFSSGGGFVLHAAGSRLGEAFARVVALSPMLGPRAPTVKAVGDAWATPFIPRIIGLRALNALGIHAFDYLTTLAFAIPPSRADILTGEYSFRLMRAFGTPDYVADLKGSIAPLYVLVGEKDELFDATKFAPTIHAVRPDVPVTIVPELNHIEMITDPRAIPPILAAIRGRP